MMCLLTKQRHKTTHCHVCTTAQTVLHELLTKNIMRCVIWKNNLDNRKQITGFSSVAYVKLYQLKYQLLLLLHY